MNNAMTPITKPTDWRIATVNQIRVEAPGVRTYTFEFDQPVDHLAGQHYEIRLTSSDGYMAARLYSAASPTARRTRLLQLTIELMPYGEVSTYIFRYVKAGAQLQLRGPLGNYFTWSPDQTEPILLIGGGTGVVPLRAIREAHRLSASPSKLQLVYSVGTYTELMYKPELFPKGSLPPPDVSVTFTQKPPAGWAGRTGRLDTPGLIEILHQFSSPPTAYVCGPHQMVEAVTRGLVEAGLGADRVRAERFGSTA